MGTPTQIGEPQDPNKYPNGDPNPNGGPQYPNRDPNGDLNPNADPNPNAGPQWRPQTQWGNTKTPINTPMGTQKPQ